jgi:hypothetical protein
MIFMQALHQPLRPSRRQTLLLKHLMDFGVWHLGHNFRADMMFGIVPEFSRCVKRKNNHASSLRKVVVYRVKEMLRVKPMRHLPVQKVPANPEQEK